MPTRTTKPNRDDFPAGDEGTRQFDAAETEYRTYLRESGDPSMKAANQGATTSTPVRSAGRRDPNAPTAGGVAAPLGEVSGKSNVTAIAGGPDPSDPKYRGMAGEMLFAKDTAAYKSRLKDEEVRKGNLGQMNRQ